ncbi:MAG: glutamine--tRNA ligase/YqeY domain fusion protein [Eubacteriaceae bacterium]|nr:glutamine--tRNA ligase/YqeY domain fusion protein [Eubacteriaceae bacterium]
MSDNTSNFIFNEIDRDIADGKYAPEDIYTRFPPEPNGYLHIGHAKAISINFSVKERYGSRCNLRFDDTNPSKEDVSYVDAIQEDIKWLGYEWDGLYWASSYFQKDYEYAKELIAKGLAYVDDQTPEEIRANRGTLTEPGKDSPWRNRSVDENMELFENMKNGMYPAGSRVLRAKIDMASPNMNLRDPVIYRINYEAHHNTGTEWCIYPMYDYAHPIEDAIEGITHSLCSLEFEDHRPLYDWVLSNLDDYKVKRPRQIEFARLNVTNTITSKRYLRALVENGVVDGWDDPRMPTICGMRRRGITPAAIKNFMNEIGVAKADSVIDRSQFDYFIRDDLIKTSKRIMGVTDPVKLTIENWPEGEIEYIDVPYIMDDEASEARKVPFSKHLLIERADFEEVPPKKYYRLFPGNEVRLMGAYFVTCTGCVKDEAGNVTEVTCTYDPATRSGSGFTGRKVKGTIHWVSADENVECEIHELGNLIKDGADSPNLLDNVNPDSLKVKKGYIEISAKDALPAERFQFVRNGFYCVDTKYTTADHLVFNMTAGMKSTWRPEKQ